MWYFEKLFYLINYFILYSIFFCNRQQFSNSDIPRYKKLHYNGINLNTLRTPVKSWLKQNQIKAVFQYTHSSPSKFLDHVRCWAMVVNLRYRILWIAWAGRSLMIKTSSESRWGMEPASPPVTFGGAGPGMSYIFHPRES